MPLSPPELEPFLRLVLVEGVGPQRLARLIESFGSAEAALSAPASILRGVPGIGPGIAARIRGAGRPPGLATARAAMRTLSAHDARALLPDDPLYPASFTTLIDPPYLLFAAGDLSRLNDPSLAVVGTRTPTAYGRRAAQGLSRELSYAGWTIVSGLARGIDTAAHLGALEAAGGTVAVLGSGIEHFYPPENRLLHRRLREEGLIVTEYPPGEKPRAGNFPRRNRLIVALSEAVVVVEMGHRSGAQHSVAYALEQGKEVMAVPGPIGSPASAGTNQLIRDGACVVTCARDVVEELRGVGAAVKAPPAGRGGPGSTDAGDRPFGTGGDAGSGAGNRSAPEPSALRTGEARLLASLSPVPAHVDELAGAAGVSAAAALAGLLELELRGLVVALPGKRFSRA